MAFPLVDLDLPTLWRGAGAGTRGDPSIAETAVLTAAAVLHGGQHLRNGGEGAAVARAAEVEIAVRLRGLAAGVPGDVEVGVELQCVGRVHVVMQRTIAPAIPAYLAVQVAPIGRGGLGCSAV